MTASTCSALEKEGWALLSQERVDPSEAREMLSHDSDILNDIPNQNLPKDAIYLLNVYEREGSSSTVQITKKKKDLDSVEKPKPNISLAERKREKKEPVIWLIFCAVLFTGSFAFFLYALPREDKDFTCWMALANSILMFLGMIYSLIQIIKTRKDF
jgi:hypothetical protein